MQAYLFKSDQDWSMASKTAYTWIVITALRNQRLFYKLEGRRRKTGEK